MKQPMTKTNGSGVNISAAFKSKTKPKPDEQNHFSPPHCPHW